MPVKWDDGQGPGTGPSDSPDSGGSLGSWVGEAARMAASVADPEAMKAMRAESSKMVASAKAGGFRISEQGAADLRATLARLTTRVIEVRGDLENRFAVTPELGSHDYGKKAAAHLQEAATEAPGSVMKTLEQLQRVLEESETALAIAVKNYQEAEANASDAFRPGQE